MKAAHEATPLFLPVFLKFPPKVSILRHQIDLYQPLKPRDVKGIVYRK